MRKIWYVLSTLLLSIQGCGTTEFNELRPINQGDIYKVIAEVKRQISVYTAYQRSPEGYPAIFAASRTKVCGNGLIGFDIVAVKMELLSTSQSTAGAGVTLGASPVGAATVGGALGASRVVTDSQTLMIQQDVSLSSQAVDYTPGALDSAPIAKAMVNLWGAALQAGGDPSDICLKLRKGSTDSNTYKISINVVKDVNGKISIGLAPVTLSANGEFKGTTGNTITVKFEPHDFAKNLPRRPMPCKPGDTREDCINKLQPAT